MPCARNQGPRSQTGPEPLVFREVFAAVYAFSVKRFGFRSVSPGLGRSMASLSQANPDQ